MPPHILVADDEATTCRLLSAVFQQAGYRVSLAHDGVQALAQFEAEPPDLVCMDLMMPKLDGAGVLQAIKANPQWAHIPVVIITAAGRNPQIDNVTALGAARCVLKPFTRNTILGVVQELLPGLPGPLPQ
jgi:chemosensory pili system protein ChpA (sensor histidine kinase/response regulator)